MTEALRNGKKVELVTVLLGLGVSVLLAGVPWAYLVHGRLVSIETRLNMTTSHEEKIDLIDNRLLACEIAIQNFTKTGDR